MPNSKDVVRGTEAEPDVVNVKFDSNSISGGVADSITGGSAATNFAVKPLFDGQKTSDLQQVAGNHGRKYPASEAGTAAANVPVKVQTGGSTNDRSKS